MMNPSSNKCKSFIDVEYAFTCNIRDPDNHPAPAGIDARRMAIYRDKVFWTTEDAMANRFRTVKKILLEEQWLALVRDFLVQHKSRSPLFRAFPQEFLYYLKNERIQQPGDPHFLYELSHYEWIKYALAIDQSKIQYDCIDIEGDLLNGIPVISPLAWPLVYQYPVHKINPGFMPEKPPEQPIYIVIYRNRHYEVNFLELNPVTAKLLEKIQKQDNKCGRTKLEEVADELNHPNPHIVITGGADTMKNLRDKEILIGVKTDY